MPDVQGDDTGKHAIRIALADDDVLLAPFPVSHHRRNHECTFQLLGEDRDLSRCGASAHR